jgi:serine/threonine protein kinase
MQGDTPRLADFGISRALETTMVSSTVIGTHSYMSPESFEGMRNIQTDVWSVGVLLYHLLTGKLPFPLGQPSEIMYAVLMSEPAPMPDEIPRRLQQIIYKALEKDRDLNGNPPRRYQTAAAMREDLESFLEWFAAQPLASPFETVKFSPTAESIELNTRMRIPVKTNETSLNNFLHTFANRNFSTTAVLAVLGGVAAIILLSVLMLYQFSSNGSAVSEAAKASNINAVAEPADDAAIRASKEFYRQADEFYRRRKFDKAIETYTLAIELNPSDYAIYNNRGAAYHASGEPQKAIDDYNKSVELNPYHFSAYNNRGAAYEDIGNIEQAVADYRKALEIDPENKLAKDNLKKILK